MRILLSLQSQLNKEEDLYCFYESFINSLIQEGNEVLVVNNAFFVQSRHQFFVGVEQSKTSYSIGLNIEKLEEQIKQFDPELVISFNNILYRNLPKLVNCPLVIWIVDSFAFLCNLDILQQNIERYHVFVASNEERQFIVENKTINIREDKVHLINWATSITSEKLNQNKNISFIGTNFDSSLRLHSHILRDPKHSSIIKEMYFDSFDRKENNEVKVPESFAKLGFSEQDYWGLIDWRVVLMIYLMDLDLTIYGCNWNSICKAIPSLNLFVSDEPKYSLKDNQDTYNSSKICININHPQAKTGFSWRVMDVMASNGCLVSKYSKGIKEFTKGYVDIPMFDTPSEARELCKKLIKDNSWREEIVAASQKCIEDKGRWKDRLVEIERALQISLIGNEKTGKLEFLKRDNFTNSATKYLSYLFERIMLKTKHLRNSSLHKMIKVLTKISES